MVLFKGKWLGLLMIFPNLEKFCKSYYLAKRVSAYNSFDLLWAMLSIIVRAKSG